MNNVKTVQLKVNGMSCSGCANNVKNVITKAGGQNVRVDFINGDADFSLSGKPDTAKTVEWISGQLKSSGYPVVSFKIQGDNMAEHHSATGGLMHGRETEIKFYISLFFTLPLVIHMFLPVHILHHPGVQLLLCCPVFFIGFTYFGKSVPRLLKTKRADMDLLIFTGINAAFFYSLAGVIMFYGTLEAEKYLFFETAATITTIVLFGNLLEKRAVRQTTRAIKKLAEQKPVKAKKVIKDGITEKIVESDAGRLAPGDVLSVNQGDRVPVDGDITWGTGTVDESMLTGESVPVSKKPGDKAFAGTILSSGNIKITAVKVGEGTVLGKIMHLVKDAQQSKPKIERFADKVSAVFTPAVLVISAATFIISWLGLDIAVGDALMNSVAVLVIACPCAMGLATPAAVMVGLGKAANEGIVMKGGDIAESFSKVQTIVFDKTGTLTTGRFKIKNINSHGELTEKELIDIVYNIEKHSSHPIAKSLERELREKASGMEMIEISEVSGSGIAATDSTGNRYKAGSRSYIYGDDGVSKDSSLNQRDICISKNNKPAGTIILEDEITRNAAEIISLFKKNKIKTAMLSGDNELNCQTIAGVTGVENVYSNQKPGEKLKVVEELTRNSLTAMVGDGVNDAPALAKSSIGISFGNATDIAIQNAGIILLNENDLMALFKAWLISKNTMRTIRQNLFWALVYNVIAIPMAACGYLDPMVAAFSMAFSDIVVIGNSLRLKYNSHYV